MSKTPILPDGLEIAATLARRIAGPALLLSLGLFLLAALLPAPVRAAGRTIVLGFDGFDPELTESWMAEGHLPHFARLAEKGHYQRLATTNPPQSPVAWASFATGLSPGAHGLFDFLSRNPLTYTPEYGLAATREPKWTVEFFGWRIPLDQGVTVSRRSGTPFWVTAERRGLPASVLRVPTTYPPDPITRMLAGMGVPDLLGTQGTYTMYATRSRNEGEEQGRWVQVEPSSGRVETVLEGPPNPLSSRGEPLSVPLVIEELAGGKVRAVLGGTAVELAPDNWSDWITVEFPFAGVLSVSGIVRLHLLRGFPDLLVYVSPIQIDPRDPVVRLSSPDEYAAELADSIGLYHTIGMPEETSSLNAGDLTDAAWLSMVKTILAEREAMLFDLLDRQKEGLIVTVFVQTDRVSHMFWRGLDAGHPLHASTDPAYRDSIRWIYGEADRILGRVMERMAPEDRLIVLSDHGFENYRRSVHLNRFLVDAGFMQLKPGAPPAEKLFTNVDWTRTSAYAIGFNGIFLNRKGREGLGVVRKEQIPELKAALTRQLLALVDPKTGRRVVDHVYDGDKIYAGPRHDEAPDLVVGYAPDYRASWQTALGGVPDGPAIVDNDRKWSGDHLIDPPAVPGVLFTSFPLEAPLPSIQQVGGLVARTLEAQYPDLPPAGPIAGEVGILDLPQPAFFAVDRAMSFLPVPLRVLLWSAAAGLVSMLVYRLLSAQKRLSALQAQMTEIRARLRNFQGELGELWPLVGRNLLLSGRRLALTVLPATIAGIPVVIVLGFLSNAFDATTAKPGAPVELRFVTPAEHMVPPLRFEGAKVERLAADRFLVTWPASGKRLTVYDSDGTPLLRLPLAAPVRTVAQRAWWNLFIGNPAGYLPQPGYVEAVELGVPQPQVIPFGPAWLRGWLVPALLVMVAVSLWLKYRWRLH